MLDCQLDAAERAEAGTQQDNNNEKPKPKFVGFSEQVKLKQEAAKNKTGPDPWLTRKFAVGIVICIFGWSYYVYVVRLCIPMVRLYSDRSGGRALGIVYLVIFHVLFVLFVWSYWMAITTAPGFARDFVPQTEPPKEQCELVTVAGQPFDSLPPPPHQPSHTHLDLPPTPTSPSPANGHSHTAHSRKESQGEGSHRDSDSVNDPTQFNSTPTAQSSDDATPDPSSSGATAVTAQLPPAPFPITFPPKSKINGAATPTLPGAERGPSDSFLHFPPPPAGYAPKKAEPPVLRVPPRVPILTEDYRYDAREGILRPYRSHRCRHCAAVVLRQDHHCPWVGSCVGARNYKYFFNFLQASMTYTLFVFLTLVIALTFPIYHSSGPRPGLDGQKVAIAAIAFLFWFFTCSLLLAHTRLILLNVTTIEELGMKRHLARERSALMSVTKWWDTKSRRQIQAAWDEEWGRVGRELNPWWLGSKRANFEMVMGKSKLGWFVPIPASPHGDDGLSYVPNPRFDAQGYPRPRSEWPAHLR